MTDLPTARGNRPIFLETEALDDMLSMLMALTQEVAVLRERNDTLERILIAKGALGTTEIDEYKPDQSVDVLREQWRQDYLGRVLFVLKSRAAERAKGDTPERYQEVVEDIAKIDA